MISEQTKSEISGKYVGSSDTYAMYLRKSRADLEMEALGEGETLARHKAMLFSLAERHGIHPDQIDIYEEVISGDSIDDRPEVQSLLSNVYAKKYKGVLVVEIERLARGNTKDQGEVADAFQFSHTHIITPAKVYDPDNEFDQEYFEFGLFMSRREFKTIRRRLASGKSSAAKEGNYIPSTPPYGFDAVRINKKERKLIEKPEESKIVKMVFDWFTEEGKSAGWIAKRLTEMGIPSATKSVWSADSIKKMLRNHHYTGLIVWNRRTTVKVKDTETGKVAKKKVKGTPEYYNGKHNGFITVEQFEKAGKILGTAAPVKHGFAVTNPFAGLMTCCDCGKPMVLQRHDASLQSRNRLDRIRHKATNHPCKKKSLPFAQVSDAVVETLKLHIADFELKLENSGTEHEAEMQQAAIDALNKERTRLLSMRKRLNDAWEADDGSYTREEFVERKQMYNARIAKLEEQIKVMEESKPEPIDYQEKITTLHAMIDTINNPDTPGAEKNRFLKQFIDRITYDVIDNGPCKGGTPILEVFLK